MDELLDDKVITSHMSEERQKYKELILIFLTYFQVQGSTVNCITTDIHNNEITHLQLFTEDVVY